MRRIFLVALIASLSTPALAQVNDLPAPDANVHKALHPGHPVPYDTGKTALQIEAERVEAYRRAYGVQAPAPQPTYQPQYQPNYQQGSTPPRAYSPAPAPVPYPQTPYAYQPTQRAPAVRQPVAPRGIENISLYSTPASSATHTVVKGDTLYNISKRYNVDILDLKRANQVRGTTIGLGQTLLIPRQKQASAAPKTPAPRVNGRRVEQSEIGRVNRPVPLAADTASRRIMRYAVAPGDTIDAIARRTCVERSLLINENELSNPDELRPGLMLTLPDNHCLAR